MDKAYRKSYNNSNDTNYINTYEDTINIYKDTNNISRRKIYNNSNDTNYINYYKDFINQNKENFFSQLPKNKAWKKYVDAIQLSSNMENC